MRRTRLARAVYWMLNPMKTALWFASLLYLAAVSSYITTAVKDEEGEAVTAKDTLRRAAPFFAMIVGGLAGFGVVIWAIQRFV